MAWPQLADGHATKDLKYRFQWNAPIMVSPQRPQGASTTRRRSCCARRDGGETWEEISPGPDAQRQGQAGQVRRADHASTSRASSSTTRSSRSASRRAEPGVIWAGSDDGLVHVTRDNGKTWQNVTPKGIPEWIQINAIDASPRDKGTAYVAATMYKCDDFRPYLYKTSDYGKTWTKIVNGIPDGAFTRVVREDPVRRACSTPGPRSASTSRSTTGPTGSRSSATCPYTPVTDLAVKNGDLVVATQGRAFWILDDLTPLRKWDATIAGSPAYLFPPRPTVRVDIEAPDEEDAPEPEGRNIPAGVVVDYWLKDAPGPNEKVTLEFFDGDTLLRSYSNEKPAPPRGPQGAGRAGRAAQGPGQAARAEGGRQPVRLGPAHHEADARAEGRLQRGDEEAAEGGARRVHGAADRRRQDVHAADRAEAAPGRVRDGRGSQGPARPAQGDPRPALRDARDRPRDPRHAAAGRGDRRPRRPPRQGRRAREAGGRARRHA